MTQLGHNGVDPTVLKRWTTEIMRVHDALDAQRIENMNACRQIREPLPDLYEAAKNAGLPSKAFKAHIKAELARRAYEKRLANIAPEDDDDSEAFEAMRAMAEDGDLFDHAVRQHDAKGGNEQDEDDPRPAFLREKHDATDVRVAENVARIKSGIKGMPGADATEA